MTRLPARLLVLIFLTGGAAGAAIIFLFDPAQFGFYPICYFRVVTGLNCPGCGATRAIHQLLHGHIAAAARQNLLLLLSLPFAAWWTIRNGAAWLQGQPMAFSIRPFWIWTFVAVASVFTVLRNLPGFEWLAP